MSRPHPQPIALFLPSLAGGGVARAMLLLAEELVRRGHPVEIVLCRRRGPYLAQVPQGVEVVTLAPEPWALARLRIARLEWPHLAPVAKGVLLPWAPPLAVRHVRSLARYLRGRRPAALVSSKTHTNLAATWAVRLAGVRVPLLLVEHSNLSQEIRTKRRRWRWRQAARLVAAVHPHADAVAGISEGVCEDLARRSGIPRARILKLPNGAVSDDVLARSREDPGHPWLEAKTGPVLLAVGRLTAQKDHATLLRAFARIAELRDARLLVLGDGELRERLARQARELGIGDRVELPGFVDNPFAYMARADLLVLSSRYEGQGLVLIEALACGCPVVSTDCPSGPAEVLQGGKIGHLVPVGDEVALARAILASLDADCDRGSLRATADPHHVTRAADRYLAALSAIGAELR